MRQFLSRYCTVLFIAWTIPVIAQPVRTVALTGQPAVGIADSYYSTVGYPVLNNSGQVAFPAILSGAGVTSLNNEGIWSGGGSSLAVVSRSGDQAPGVLAGAQFAHLFARDSFSPTIRYDALDFNDLGQTAFLGTLVGGGLDSTNNIGIFSDGCGALCLVAKTGDHAVGAAAGYYYRSFLAPLLNSKGQTAFGAYLGGTGNTSDRGIWAQYSGNLELVAQTGIQAPGLPAGTAYTGFGDGGMLSDGGKLVFYATLSTNSIGAYNGIWSSIGGQQELVARSGQATPETFNAPLFETYGLQPSLNERGDILFGASTVDGSSGYWLADSNGLRLRLASGGPAAGTNSGVNFTAQSSAVINNSDDIAYVGTIAGPGVDSANNSGVWLDRSSNATLIARSGMHAADTPDDLVFSYFGSVDINDLGQVVFAGALVKEGTSIPSSTGLWATDRNGNLHLVARTDQLLEVGPGDLRKINYIQFLGNFNASEFNNLGQVAFWARFTDGSSGAFVSNVAAIPEPNCGLSLVLSMLVSFGVTRLPRVYV